MSRYSDYDDYDEDWGLSNGRWERNSRVVFTSRKGQKALRQLRDALLALPDKRLISGALSTIGRSREVERTKAEVASGNRSWIDGYTIDLEDNITRQGEGVCAVGALLLHHYGKQGKTREEAAAIIPAACNGDGDGLDVTARAARDAGMVYTLAWQVAYRNDETLESATPEERYTKMLAWVESKLESVPA